MARAGASAGAARLTPPPPRIRIDARADTSRIVAEAALSLAFDDPEDLARGCRYPPRRSGVLTPAAAFGLKLVDRLGEHGMRLTHERIAENEE